MDPVHQQSFASLRTAYRSGELTPVDVVRSALDHAEQISEATNAFALLDRNRALDAAERSSRRWRQGTPLGGLDGMPMTVKEFAAVQSWPTRRGSVVTSPLPATESTVFVERLEAAGVVLLGKTRAPEFNWKGVTDSPGYGITRNPWDLSLTPGGSSGGCAAAISAGVVRISFGSDAGGSVRIPAAFCGILGLKPTFGLIPLHPFPSHFSNTAHIGPLGVDGEEMLQALQIVSGRSPKDWTSVSETIEAKASAERSLDSLRVGILSQRHWSDCEATVEIAMSLVIDVLQSEGLAVQEVDFDIRGASAVGQALYQLACRKIVDGIGAGDRLRLDQGLVACANGMQHFDLDDYLIAIQRRDAYGIALASIFENVDVLISPTVPIFPFAAGLNVPDGSTDPDWFSWNPYTPAYNALHVPALSYPIWVPNSKLPVGIQLATNRLLDRRLLLLAKRLQNFFPIRLSPLSGN